jgi:hypothetical protein
MSSEGDKLAAKIAFPLTLKALPFERHGGFRNRLLITSKPAIPTVILRSDAAYMSRGQAIRLPICGSSGRKRSSQDSSTIRLRLTQT